MSKQAREAHADNEKNAVSERGGTEIAETARQLNEELQNAVASADTPVEATEPDLPNEPGAQDIEPPRADVEQTTEDTNEEVSGSSEESPDEGIPDDPVIEEAIDDIVAQEADVVLEAEDQSRQLDSNELPIKEPKPKSRVRRFFGSSLFRWSLFVVLTLTVFAIGVMPKSRYYVLNSFGVRSSVTLSVIDELTRQPLKNVSVRVANKSGLTDKDGKLTIEKVELGPTQLQIEKRAFAVIERDVTIGWGSNPLGEFEAKAVGAQYEFIVKDSLSGKPIKGAEVDSGDGNATSDADGKVVLTLDTAELEDDAQVSIHFSAAQYRDEVVKVNVNNKEGQSVELVPSRKHVYVSKRSGTYDVYAAHIDGKNEKKLVTGSGLERDDIALIPHQKDEVAALVSSRENVRSSEDYLLSTLYILNTTNGSLVKIDQSDQIQVIGWDAQGHLVYVKIAAGAAGTDPKRHRLMSFNYKDFTDVTELASTNAFNDVVMANGRVYFAQSGTFNDASKAGVFAVNPDGSDKKTLLSKEVESIVRTNYETMFFRVGDGWYRYEIGSASAPVSGASPGSTTSRIYADNATKPFSLWRDSRDGKGVLLSYNKTTKKDVILSTRSGLNLPMYWLGEKYVIYRVNDGSETADYVLNSEGGDARKIADVTDYAGIGRWFFY